jgi:hypothetical protein
VTAFETTDGRPRPAKEAAVTRNWKLAPPVRPATVAVTSFVAVTEVRALNGVQLVLETC